MNEKIELFQVTLKAIIANKENKMLLLKSAEDGTWILPGGRLEKEENIEKELLREIEEETQLKVELIDLIHAYYYFSKTQQADKVCVCFAVKAVSEEVKLSEEHNAFKWVSLNELNEMNLPKDFSIAFEKTLKKLG